MFSGFSNSIIIESTCTIVVQVPWWVSDAILTCRVCVLVIITLIM
jgi:hypothetical protein